MALQTCMDAFLQDVLFLVQAQWLEGSEQKVEPEMHKDAGISIPASTTGPWKQNACLLLEFSRIFWDLLEGSRII